MPWLSPNLARFARQKKRASIEEAREQLRVRGITEEQREAYKPLLSNYLQRAISPYGYSYDIRGALKRVLSPIFDRANYKQRGWGWDSQRPAREDAWRFYLGLPQVADTFGISDYKPSISKEDKTYYKLNQFWPQVQKSRPRTEEWAFDDLTNVMNRFKWGQGSDTLGDYISYYDKWNLEETPEGEKGLVGKPFEIYDRLYYNPQHEAYYWEGPPARVNPPK